MYETTGSDIQQYEYVLTKAKNNDISITPAGHHFLMVRIPNKATLGKFLTVGEMFQYLCGYEAGLDRGLIDGINS